MDGTKAASIDARQQLAEWMVWLKAREIVVASARLFCQEPWSTERLNTLHESVEALDGISDPWKTKN